MIKLTIALLFCLPLLASGADYYVDPGGGNDTTGDGSSGTPWATVQKALDTITAGATGDRINVKAGTSDSLSSSLSFATYGNPTAVSPLRIQGYTTTAADGGIGEIDGGGSVAIVDDVSIDYLTFIDMKLGNVGSAHIVSLDNNCNFTNCELHTSTNVAPIDLDLDATLTGCHAHTFTSTGATAGVIVALNNFRMSFCYIDGSAGGCKNGALNLGSVDFKLDNSIIHVNDTSARGIELTGLDGSIINCTFYNESAGTESGIWSSSGSSASGVILLNNIFEGWSGTGGVPIKLTAAGSEGALMVAGNSYFNNATNAPSWAGQSPLYERDNQIPSASLLNDPNNGDFSITTEGKEAGHYQLIGSTATKIDVGAAQREEPAGGGGGGTVIYSN